MDIKIQSERQLAKHLKHDMRLLSVCAFEDFFHTPSHATFSNFRTLIGDETFFNTFHNLVSQAFALGLIWGQITATDATHLWAYSNKFGKKLCTCPDKAHCNCSKTYSDPNASWGYKNKNYAFFGYKVHLIVDAKSQLPISVTITQGSTHDSQQAIPLLNQLKEQHPALKPKFNTADSGYDSHEIYKKHLDSDITPIIDLNEKRKTNPLITKKIKLADGHPYCKRAKLTYWGFDPNRNRFKFRCPLACGKISSCKYSQKCFTSSYGKTFYLHHTDDIRLFPEIPRYSEQWKLLYNNRTSVERTNSELKDRHAIENIRFRTITKIKSHVYMSCISLLLKRCSEFFTNPAKYNYAFSTA